MTLTMTLTHPSRAHTSRTPHVAHAHEGSEHEMPLTVALTRLTRPTLTFLPPSLQGGDVNGGPSRTHQLSFRDAFGLARRRLAAAPQVCKNAARTWSLDVERSSSGFVRSRTVHTHAASLQVRGWPLDSDSRGCAR